MSPGCCLIFQIHPIFLEICNSCIWWRYQIVQFLALVSTLMTDIDIAILSVAFWYSIETTQHIVTVSSQHDSPIILVYHYQTTSRNSDGVTTFVGAKYRWGIKISPFSTNKSLYLTNDTKERHSYCRRRISNCTCAFEWYQFQWTWVTSNQDFN